MGKISLELIAKSHSHTKKRRDETVQQYVRRLTHLYFSEKNIDEIVSKIYFWLFTRSMIVKFLLIIKCCICLYLFHTIISFHQVYLNEAFQSTFGKTVLKIIWFSLISNFRRLMMVLFSFICCRIISITAAIYRSSTFMTITFQRSRILDLQATWLTYIFKKIK